MAGTLKGWLFVAVTSLLLYRLMRRLLRRGKRVPWHPRGRSLVVPLALLALAIIGLTAAGIAQIGIEEREKEAAELRAIADLKVQQIEDWVSERYADARFAQSSQSWVQLYRRWRDTGDIVARDQLLTRLGQFPKIKPFQALTLLDEHGVPLWNSEGESLEIDSALRATALEAAAKNEVRYAGPFRDAGGRWHVAFVTALPAIEGRPGPIVVLDADPATKLYPMLRSWPTPSTSGEMFLYRRDGNEIRFLSDLRHRAGSVDDPEHMPITGRSLAAKVARGEAEANTVLEGHDYRHVRVLGVVREVHGTDWFLVAKIDRSEIWANIASDVLTIVLAGALALLVTGAGVFVLRQRHELAASLHERAIQAEKLSALKLLDAIADASADAIVAKDIEGRYLLFNREATRVTGKDPATVLGHDDHSVFGPEDAAKVVEFDRRVLAENCAITREEVLATVEGARTFLTTKGPLCDAEGNTFGLFAVARDITERKRMEDALRESEQTYRSLFENMR
ncbi:MAG TPA: PAS domain-containing protein, partial [Casimicrobiaceae bacterium]